LIAEIHEIVSAICCSRVAIAGFERSVELWDIETNVRVQPLETIYEGGGRRLEVAPDGVRLFAGAYEGPTPGVAAYSVETGKREWLRRDLVQVQRIAASRNGQCLYCSLENGTSHVLETTTGAEVERLRDARGVYVSPFSDHLLIEGEHPRVVLADGTIAFCVARGTCAVLDAAFSPTRLCTSDSGGDVRVFELPDGNLVWRYAPPHASHVLGVPLFRRCHGPLRNTGLFPDARQAVIAHRPASRSRRRSDARAPVANGDRGRKLELCVRGALALLHRGKSHRTRAAAPEDEPRVRARIALVRGFA